MLNMEHLIIDLKDLHKKIVSVYKNIFDFKFNNNTEFKKFIDNEYKVEKVDLTQKSEISKWNNQFFHRSAYTLINKILFIRICEDKGFMLNESDLIMGEEVNSNNGKKLSMVGLQKWTNLISNYTLSELLKFAFKDMNQSYKNVSLYREDKYDLLIPSDEELLLLFINDDRQNVAPIKDFEDLLEEIIEVLDTSKYNFSSSSDNVLGDVYEKFMDRDTRKALGQFYTPDFVIDYILNNTVKSVNVLDNPFVKVLDPSCGSGHFLIMAYDLLREKFEESLIELRVKYKDDDYLVRIGEEEHRIKGNEYWTKKYLHYHLLSHCIYGADIDEFAIQLTTINLLLKDLDNLITDELNIIMCDSLLKWNEDFNWKQLQNQIKDEGSLFYKVEKKTANGDLEYKDVDYNKALEIVRICEFWNNKFDFVIGNPPYGSRKRLSDDQKKYYGRVYFEEGDYDTYMFFLWRSIEICKGDISFITPNGYFTNIYNTKLRSHIFNNTQVKEIINMKSIVFDDANVDTVITLFDNRTPPFENTIHIKVVEDFNEDIYNSSFSEFSVLQDDKLKSPKDNMLFINSGKTSNLEEKLYIDSVELKEIAYCGQGIIVYGTKEERKKGGLLERNKSGTEWKRTLKGRHTGYFTIDWEGLYVKYGPWLRRSRNEEHLKANKILIQRLRNANLARRLVCSYDNEGYYVLNNHNYLITKNKNYLDGFLLAILNSNLINYYYGLKYTDVNIKENYIRKLPIKKLEQNQQIKLSAISFEVIEKLKKSLSKIVEEEFEKGIEINLYSLVNITKQYDEILKEINILLLQLNFMIYTIYEVDEETILSSEEKISRVTKEKTSILKNIKEFIKSPDNFIGNFIKQNSQTIKDDLPKEKFYEEFVVNKKGIDQIAGEYGYEYVSISYLRDYYAKDSNSPEEFYELIEVKKILNIMLSKEIKMMFETNGTYMNQDLVSQQVSKYMDISKIINALQLCNTKTLTSKDIIKDAMNSNSITWKQYIKKIKKDSDSVLPIYVKYESNIYGLTNRDGETHKTFCLDAINYYTSISEEDFKGTVFEGIKKTKSKAETALNILKDLNFKDKEDYIEILTEKVKKAFD